MNKSADTRDNYFGRYVPLPTLPEPPLTWDTLTSASLDVIPLFDRTGRAVGWMLDGVIFDEGLEPRAFLHGTGVFNYRCQYLGQWAGGLMRDRRGEVVAFSEGALHGPALPIPRWTPAPLTLPIPPAPPVPNDTPIPAAATDQWSSLSWEGFLS